MAKQYDELIENQWGIQTRQKRTDRLVRFLLIPSDTEKFNEL